MAGHGGGRPGAGRKPKAAEPEPEIDLTAFEGLSAEKIMEIAAQQLLARRQWDAASKAAARLAAARRSPVQAQGKKQTADALAKERTSSGRFAPPPPPKFN